MIQIHLTPDEEERAAEMARAVNANKRRLGMPPKKWKEETDLFTIRRDAFRAEIAVATFLGLTWEIDILPGGDGGVDLTLPVPTAVGSTVQVKWRGERERDLATGDLDFHHDLRADLYVLAWPGPEEAPAAVTLVGWCTRDDFIHRIVSRPPVRMLGRKWEMRWGELRPIEDLWEEVTYAKYIHATKDRPRGEDALREGHPGERTVA